MDLGLKGKRVLVTGSTQGIGLAIAKALAEEGAAVILNGRDRDRTEQAARVMGHGAVGIAADVATAEGCAALVQSVQAIGPLDVLVNNAGFFEVKTLPELQDADWLAMFQRNVMSGVRLSKAFLPGMLQRGWGRIVFIASEQSAKPNPDMLHYAMTKAAQVSVARGLAEMTKGTDVTVNSVLVAPTWTEGVEVFLGRVAGDLGTTVEGMRSAYFTEGDGTNSLIHRFAEPEEIAAQVTFLCSTVASAINGAAQRVDGGIIRSML